jgi:hypothetical protein
MGSNGTSFTFRRVGTTGCEILADGKVIAWTMDEPWAAVIVALLDGAGEEDPSLSAARHEAAGNPSIPE